MKLKSSWWLTVLPCLLFRLTVAQASPVAETDDYTFDDNLLRGNPLGLGTLSRFNKVDSVEPGNYQVDLYLNDRFIRHLEMTFTQEGNDTLACYSAEILQAAGVKKEALDKPVMHGHCLDINATLPGSSSRLDFSQLRLNLSVPQKWVSVLPRGYVDPRNLDSGNSIGFVNYNANQYHVDALNGSGQRRVDSGYVNLNGGINLGLWRLRQDGALRSDSRGNRWENNRRYVQRALPELRSELTAGETYTGGQFFSSLGYRGVALATDDRMLPDSLRGYAPVVRGIAKTNARVTVYQNNRAIYQTTVPPGAFQIDDLSATNYGGDLQIDVSEADGSVSSFRIPFASVPDSLRPGLNRYALAAGRVRDTGNNEPFAELTFQRGISNPFTLNSGLRVADGYQAAMLGGVFTHYIGAFGLDTTYSSADLPGGEHQNGWMMRASYSRSFQPLGTTFTLAGYRYSTQGYRDLNDVLTLRAQGDTQTSNSYLQRSRLEVSLNQSLHDYGAVYLSASSQDYRDDRPRDTQMQFGYSTVVWNNVSLNLSVTRQRTSSNSAQVSNTDDLTPSWNTRNATGESQIETMSQFTLSFPLGGNPSAPYVSAGMFNSKNNGASYQTSLSGVSGDDQSLSYSADFARQQQSKENTWSGSLQKRLPLTSLSASASRGSSYWQSSASARGAVAVHSGGVTLGPYLSDTFALVEAKGATGAKVLYGQGASIDRFGYALVPTLTPYRYNTVTLDPQEMAQNTELQDGQRRVAPFAGSAVKITFRTLTGYPVLIATHMPQGDTVPMGADVLDAKGASVGMVGQAGQAYLRAATLKGRLTLKWGDDSTERCHLDYDLGKPAKDQPIINLTAACVPG